MLNSSLFFVRFIVWCFQWSVALALFLVVMAGAGYYVFTGPLAGGQQVTVPNITGLSIMDANLRLAEQGLDLGKQALTPHATVPKYHVITQQPPAGRVVRTGRRVYPTVSMGTAYMQAPSYLQMTIEAAQRAIEQSRFRLGSVARIPHAAPRDTVIAQDPPAGLGIANEGAINLLVSGGLDKRSAFMPNLRGMGVDEARRAMTPFNVTLVANEIDAPTAKEGVVLDQRPGPDSLIYEGQVVTYDVKASGSAAAAQQYNAEVRHVMPYDWFDRDVRVEMTDHTGKKSALWSKPPAFDDASRATFVSGSSIRLPIAYVAQAGIEVIVDGQRIAAYQLSGGADPVKTFP